MLQQLLETELKIMADSSDAAPNIPGISTQFVEDVGSAVRLYDMILDSAWHMTDSLYPARQPEYTYRSRPYWWWQIRANNQRADEGETSDFDIHSQHFFESLDLHPAQTLANFPLRTFSALIRTVNADLLTRAPASFDAKTSRRPVTILSTSGYGGKSISTSVVSHIGFLEKADVIHLDASTLADLAGTYLGQNLAYTRGSLSMLGFRAADLSGRLARDPDQPVARPAEEDDEEDTPIITMRGPMALEDELQKVRQGGPYETFSKWDSLKLDKLLDQVISSVNHKNKASSRTPLIVHLHDYVEMSMTLEGSFIIARLRVLIDTAWQHGQSIALVGTSSCQSPSDQYLSMLGELSANDLVVSRDLRPAKAAGKEGEVDEFTQLFDHRLGQADMFLENVANMNRMIAAMSPGTQIRFQPSDDVLKAVTGLLEQGDEITNPVIRSFLQGSEDDGAGTKGPVVNAKHLDDKDDTAELARRARIFLRKRTTHWVDSIMPAAEIYRIAKQYMAQWTPSSTSTQDGLFLLHSSDLHPLQPRQSAAEEKTDRKGENGESHPDGRPMLPGLNSYEKRIASSGHISKNNLRVTFADVHVPKQTISSLKLLTSLALVRPEAFEYGVLKDDKIPGCLLYGPPGTGKTMLAKAVAKESGANMIEVSGASINDKWVGESEKLIRAVFTLAKRLSPCVVFIDEADAMLASRSMFSSRPSHRELINQFLKEWDGMEETSAFIMVATNRPFDLDDAVLRRLPRKILVDLPTKEDRAAILKLLLRGEQLEDSVSLEGLAARTPFYSGSDLKNLCVAAAMSAVEEENEAAAAAAAAAELAAADLERSGGKAVNVSSYRHPEKRTLRQSHFEKGLSQIPASISEDMSSLKLIRKFDEEYGDGRKGKGKKKGMGFGGLGMVEQGRKEEDVRIRPGTGA